METIKINQIEKYLSVLNPDNATATKAEKRKAFLAIKELIRLITS